MSTFWIFVVISCCFSQVFSIGFGLSAGIPLDSVDVKNREVQDVKDHSRLYSKAANTERATTKTTTTKKPTTPLPLRPSASCPTNSTANEIIFISTSSLEPFEVLCNSEIAGPGWAMIASRSNPNLNFFRLWRDYKLGFGNLTDDFFIGLDKLHAITATQQQELYIYLEDFNGNKRFARYDNFMIDEEAGKYALNELGKYSGDMGDSLSYHKLQKFSTYDSDNDLWGERDPAFRAMGGWWYKYNTTSNLFGLYINGAYPRHLPGMGMFWDSWRGYSYSYKVMHMMVKPKLN